MPFIDSKITVSLTPEKEEAVKTKLGEAIQILNKSETYLMVGFEDNYDLYMGGSKLDKGAYVSVSHLPRCERLGLERQQFLNVTPREKQRIPFCELSAFFF